MKTVRIALFLLLLLVIACSAEPEVLDGAGTLALSRQAIVNGEASTEPAVVGLHQLINHGTQIYIKPFCTGTLIRPGVVLTAAHCLDKSTSSVRVKPMSPGELAIYVGDDPAGYDEEGNLNLFNSLYAVQRLRVHPSYNKLAITDDLGIVRLVTTNTGVEPIPPLPPSKAIEGTEVGELNLHMVGFGQIDPENDNSYGVKMQGDALLSGVLANDTQIEHTYDDADSDNDNAICFGDSGGPAIVMRDPARFVGGVASYVTVPYCTNTGVHTKVDAYSAFIDDFAPPCGDGVCAADESCASCPEECGECQPACGDEECSGDETCATCSADCGECPTCDDDVCNGDETCATCPVDCGECQLACGDGTCGADETCANCAADCGECPVCLDKGDSCLSNSDCCSGRCKRTKRCG